VKWQNFGVKGEAVLKMRNTWFWDKGMKVHSVCCSLFSNDIPVVETLFSLDCPTKFCSVKQASCTKYDTVPTECATSCSHH
jgi:hypothetical protein